MRASALVATGMRAAKSRRCAASAAEPRPRSGVPGAREQTRSALLAGQIEYSEANERKACAEIALNRNTRACTELLTVLYSYLHDWYNNTLEYQRNQEGTLPFVDKNFLV
jgi:hypothetical protein